MQTSLITLEYLNKETGMRDMFYVIPKLRGTKNIFSENDGYVNNSDPLPEKLHLLGLTPGERFFIIKADTGAHSRNNWEAVWGEKHLYNEQINECGTCEHFNTPNWGWEYCSDCGDGLNITGSFFISAKYAAIFDEPENNKISGR